MHIQCACVTFAGLACSLASRTVLWCASPSLGLPTGSLIRDNVLTVMTFSIPWMIEIPLEKHKWKKRVVGSTLLLLLRSYQCSSVAYVLSSVV